MLLEGHKEDKFVRKEGKSVLQAAEKIFRCVALPLSTNCKRTFEGWLHSRLSAWQLKFAWAHWNSLVTFTSGERRNNTTGVVIFLINISCCSEERILSDVLPLKCSCWHRKLQMKLGGAEASSCSKKVYWEDKYIYVCTYGYVYQYIWNHFSTNL